MVGSLRLLEVVFDSQGSSCPEQQPESIVLGNSVFQTMDLVRPRLHSQKPNWQKEFGGQPYMHRFLRDIRVV